jgi:hypothetical protein
VTAAFERAALVVPYAIGMKNEIQANVKNVLIIQKK